jgi:hypothetical protein
MNSELAGLLDALNAELDVFAQRIDAGLDIAPARRARFEGMTAAALALGMESDALLAACREHLPNGAQLMFRPGMRALQLDIWQRRAPVEPSTH